MKGIVIAGTRSGVGKTVATLAIIHALQDRGYTVQPAKAGPDFIDPSHHEVVAGRPSRTLDTWLEGQTGVRRNYYRGTGDVCVVEGVMGLYDGDVSSTAMVAEALELPVVLVVDAQAGMESVAATAHGFREYARHVGRDIDVVGVIAQRAHGGRHEQGIRDALPDGMASLGRIPPRTALELPDRHLGLHMGEETTLSSTTLETAAAELRIDQLLAHTQTPPRPAPISADESATPTIAVARDAAFRFIYPATLEHFHEHATIRTFSPLAGDDLPSCDGVYLPGGYPERHAKTLAESASMATIAAHAADGLPVFGECGGLMALAESLTTADGETVSLAGVLPAAIQMHDQYQALDHVELHATRPTLTAVAGDTRRGHEFHYSSADVAGDARFAFTVDRGDGIQHGHDGLTEYQTLGTYAHFHPAGGSFDSFLAALQE